MKVGLPRDPAQWLAIAFAALALVVLPRRLVKPRARQVTIAILGGLAALLSAAYVAVYLRGGPRIIDATSYFLEARALAHGLFAWNVPEPSGSILGRFLVRAPSGSLSVIFPPGYPALLAAGFAIGAPLAIGPALAAALVVATAELARRVEDRASRRSEMPDLILLAALFSVVCAALRYHTADTMSHGLAALCFTAALAATLAALDRESVRLAAMPALIAGLFTGWLLATRPVSALALAAGLVFALASDRSRAARHRSFVALMIAVGGIPGAALLAVHQLAATGAIGASSQSLYYAVSDGPPGCFAYGFGASIGCAGEHGDFVRARLADGYGLRAALGTTLRRLWMHLLDVANVEPLGLLVPLGAWFARRSPRARLLAVCVGLQIAAYAPFYFDGNYPGGGARFYADVLPIEHVLAALAIVSLAARARTPAAGARVAAAFIALACIGFAVRAGFDHAMLRDREGGLPMFESSRLAASGISRGLVFVNTDHGFNLAYDPAPNAPLDVVRLHHDGLDRLAWEARGKPDAHLYDFAIPETGLARVTISPFSFDENAPLVVEGESLWPPLRQTNGWAWPDYAGDSCVSRGQWLRIRRGGDSAGSIASIELALPARLLAGRTLAVRIAESRAGIGAVRVVFGPEKYGDSRTSEVALGNAANGDVHALCRSLEPFVVPLGAAELHLALEFTGGDEDVFALDAIDLDGKTH